MCGRYLLTSPVDSLRQLFRFEQRPNLMPRYNIAPTQEVPIVRFTRGASAHELIMVRWGLVPLWADDLKGGARLINARCETVDRIRPFREAYRRRRCLIPADGFFEWRKDGKARQPFLFRRKDQAPFAFAGLWERWRDPADDSVVRSCTIVTCPPNQVVAPLHDRMPVILDPRNHEQWLDPAATDARSLLVPCPAESLESIAVNSRVNSPKHDDPACIQPAIAQTLLDL